MKIRVGKREQKVFPKEYQDRLTLAGGRNRFGEPNFRGIWGWSRLDWLYHPRTGSYIKAPRYPVRPSRFYIEQYLPQEKFGSPWEWTRLNSDRLNGVSFDVLGPYPSRGDYELLLMLESPHVSGCESVAADEYDGCPSCRGGRFIQPTSWIVDQIARLVERSRDRSERDRHNDVLAMKNDWVKNFEGEAEDRIKDLQGNFGSQTVFLGGLVKGVR